MNSTFTNTITEIVQKKVILKEGNVDFTDQSHFQYPFDVLVEFVEDLILHDSPVKHEHINLINQKTENLLPVQQKQAYV